MKVVISSGHGKFVRGASGLIDEVDEARRVVPKVAEYLAAAGVGVITFHDDVSRSQNENLNVICNFHNKQNRDLDVSVHFNCYDGSASGTECLYVTQQTLATKVADKVSIAAGFKNRGPKKRTDLFFLNNTDEPAILVEVCFVDSQKDVDLYHEHFEAVCAAISEAISGVEAPTEPEPPEPEGLPESGPLLVIEPVTIFQLFGGSYVAFKSNLDICNDGSGPSHGDPHHQSATAYQNGGRYLNADVDKYLVIPPQLKKMGLEKVMGCQARLTNLRTGDWTAGMIGEVGPDDKTGEAAYCAAICVNPGVTYNSGDLNLIYLYEFWPGVPAVVDGKQYKLE